MVLPPLLACRRHCIDIYQLNKYTNKRGGRQDQPVGDRKRKETHRGAKGRKRVLLVAEHNGKVPNFQCWGP